MTQLNEIQGELAHLYRWMHFHDDGTERCDPPSAEECQQALIGLLDHAYRMALFNPNRHFITRKPTLVE